MKKPYIFDEFFSSGLEETISPFLTPTSRHWAKNVPLKSALLSLVFLSFGFSFSFINQDISSLFLSFVYFLSGVPAIIGSLKDLQKLEINIDTLMTVAAFIALLIGSQVEGALLLVLFELSHGLEDLVTKKAKSALNSLNTINPKSTFVQDDDGNIFEKAVQEIQTGEKIFVKQGEIIPLDGEILQGSSCLNVSHLTGESLPILKTIGQIVPAGAKNLDCALLIQVTKTKADSTISQLIKLISKASEAKPKLERFFDQFSSRYATSIIALTFIFSICLPFILSISITESIYRSLAFLIAASPCALIIATPTAYLSAINACAKKGIILKGGITLDALTKCSVVAFDKTGTLTTGDLQIVSIEANNPDLSLAIAAGLEMHVTHPIAKSICSLANEKSIKPIIFDTVKVESGLGIKAILDGKQVIIGLPEFVGVKVDRKNQTVAVLKFGDDISIFRFKDTIRLEIKNLLKTLSLRCIMLTGDHHRNAAAVAQEVGIEEVYADLRPEDKLEKVSHLSDKVGLAMVGDGINDAPALARATVGISMGKIGSGSAVDASDVILLNDNIHHLQWLFAKANNTSKIVKQNLTVALIVILFATIPSLMGKIPLWLAVLLHEGGTVLVGLNSLRLLKK